MRVAKLFPLGLSLLIASGCRVPQGTALLADTSLLEGAINHLAAPSPSAEPLESNPYRAPAFEPLPPPVNAGHWEQMALQGASPSPSVPSALPTTTPEQQRLAPPYPPPTLPRKNDAPACPSFSAADWSLPRLHIMPDSPWLPVLPVGGTLRIGNAYSLRLDDERMGRLDKDGVLTALRPGAIRLTAQSGGLTARIMVACVASPEPAIQFVFNRDWSVPSDAATRGPRIIRDEETWRRFWKDSFFYHIPETPPEVDFSQRSLVVLVDDRVTNGEDMPVLTHVSDNGTAVNIVMPGIADQGSVGYRRAVFIFQTGKLPEGARVRLQTFCQSE